MRRAALSLLFLTFALQRANANTSPINLDDLKEKIDQEHRLLLETEIKKRGILGHLYEINKNISKVSSDIDNLGFQLGKSKVLVETHAKNLARFQSTLDQQKKLLRVRLRALYKMGIRGYAELALSSKNGDEFSRNMKFLKIIAVRDQKLIESYRNGLIAIAKQQLKLRHQVKIYAKFEKLLNEEKRKYDDQKGEQLYLLSKIEKDREMHFQAIREWREAGRKLEEKLLQLGLESQVTTDLSRGAFFEQRGILKPPVIGEVTEHYGIIENHKFNTKIFHKGLFFGAILGSKVTSLFWGKVAFAGWINCYGETIIIDHGDHYYTLYAHNSKLDKKSGDDVSSNEVIAEVGDTGSLKGAGLYIEIRHFSESLDPLPWLDLNKTKQL